MAKDDNPGDDVEDDNSEVYEAEGDTEVGVVKKEHLDDEIYVEASEDVTKEDIPGDYEVDVEAVEDVAKEDAPGPDDDDAKDDAEEDSDDDDVRVLTIILLVLLETRTTPPSPKLFSCSNHPQVERVHPVSQLPWYCQPGLPHLTFVSRLSPRPFGSDLWLEPNSCKAVKIKDLSCQLKLPPAKSFWLRPGWSSTAVT